MVRTRFAPSPTGFLHIGGVRTALFNWLYARRHGGKFVLRIDDTDAQRNVEAALEPILHGFRWLGLEWDEGPEIGGSYGPYYQSERSALYTEAVATLLERDLAYPDYASTEELQAEREAAQQEKRRFVYSRKFMAESDADVVKFEAEGRKAVVRLKMPRSGSCRFTDLIRGEMDVEWALEQDHVIQRADGSCLYNLCNVVDDQAMEITHVIRAEEHLSNTARQVFIARGLGYKPPEFAHLPFVAEPGSKNKLSKRKLEKYLKHGDFAKLSAHGNRIAQAIGLETDADTFNPVLVDFYEQIGFLPDAILNYLMLLGWSYDDRTEDFTRQQMIDNFSLERVNKAAASFDPQKLMAFQERRMGELPVDDKVRMTLPYLVRAGVVAEDETEMAEPRVYAVIEAADDRIKVAGDIIDYADFFVAADALTYDEKAFEKRLRKPEEAVGLLGKFRGELAETNSFEAAALETLFKKFIEAEGIKIGQLIHAVRVAVTGKAVGFGMWETLAILGRDACLARIDRTLARL